MRTRTLVSDGLFTRATFSYPSGGRARRMASRVRLHPNPSVSIFLRSGGLTADISFEEWNLIPQVNVTGTWLCMREELKHMLSRGSGTIVNTASFAGLHTIATQTAYVASKHAVIGLTKNAAIEYAAHGIRINAVAPGGIATPMLERNLGGLDGAQRAAALEAISNYHPMKRLGEAVEIADAMLFLCSDQASFITGACLSVDGGWAAI